MKYFINPTPQTLEELKKMYHKLSLRFHPDLGGTTADMQAVNAEYTTLFDKLKEIHTNADGETYRKPTNETPEAFVEIINQLIHFEGITIEIVGQFIWCSQNTKPYKEQLKALGFKWANNKSAWYLPYEGYKKRNKKVYNLNEIREMFGSQEVETKPYSKVADTI